MPPKHPRTLLPCCVLTLALLIAGEASRIRAAPGDLDLTFNGTGKLVGPLNIDFSNSYAIFQGLVLQPDGKVAMGGTTNYGTHFAMVALRYTSNGTNDGTWGAGSRTITPIGTSAEGWTINRQGDGKLVLAGNSFDGVSNDFALVRYNANGTLDTGFGNGGKVVTKLGNYSDTVFFTLIQPNGKIVAGGEAGTSPGSRDIGLVRYNSNGSIDTSFGTNGRVIMAVGIGTLAKVETMAVQADGKIVVVVSNSSSTTLLRLTSTGDLDTDFGSNGEVTLLFSRKSVLVQPDQKLVVTGLSGVSRYSTTGVLDGGFGTGGHVSTTIQGFNSAIQRNGKIVVGGYYNDGSGNNFSLERFMPDGTTDTEFGLNGQVVTSMTSQNDYGFKPSVLADGRIYLLGTGNNGTSFALARYLGDGAPAATAAPATLITDISARLSGAVNPRGNPTTVNFEYGTTKSYGMTASVPLTPNNNHVVQGVATNITSLQPHTVYYYRLTATNVQGTDVATGSFKTLDTITITAPAGNATIIGSYGGSITVTGTSVDPRGTQKVQVAINGGPWTDAILTPATLGTNYSLIVNPLGGLNSLEVRVMETDGQFSPVEIRTFTYVVKRPLTVQFDGTGTVAGQLNGASYQVGKTYTLTAKPGAGQVFDGWSGPGLSGASTEVAKLIFVYSNQLSDSPTITAKFIANPFIPAVIGSFNGLVKADGSVTPSASTNGFITAKVTSTGGFTGTLKIDGLSTKIAGLFDNTGTARFTVSRSTLLTLPRLSKPALLLALVLDLSPNGTQRIIGTLSEQTRSGLALLSLITADRAAFDGKSALTSVPSDYLVNKGLHTIALPSVAQTNGLTSDDFPQGDSHGSITVTKAGQLSMTVTMADGLVVTASSPLSKALTAPLFAQLYVNKGGCLGGEVKLDKDQPDTDLSGTGFFWFKPYVGGQYHPYGWSEGVFLNLVGSRYSVTPGISVLPGLSGAIPNATLVFSSGALTSTVTKSTQIGTTNSVTKVPTTDSSFTLAIAAASGKIFGTFTHTDGSKPAYSGVILQKGSNARAFGFFQTVKPKAIDGSGTSGRVSLAPAGS